jgi:excinuclease UvrABC ATPase subunit
MFMGDRPRPGGRRSQIIACGTPETVAACPESITGQMLKKLL